jgi:extradiol dioxygenase family protein
VTPGFTFQNMYQMGFVVRDVDEAVAHYRDKFGVAKFRILRHNEDIATAHAYVGNLMLELVQISDKGPAQFIGHAPQAPQVAQFHHNAYRITSQEDWDDLAQAIENSGKTYFKSSAMNGGMNVFFVDLRDDIGMYVEYVFTKGEAEHYYDSVPRNDPISLRSE